MKLQQQLDTKRNHIRNTMPPEAAHKIEQGLSKIVAERLLSGPLPLGAAAPDFVLPDHLGENRALSDALTQGPALLVFFRGSWCPFCSIALRAYQSVLPEIKGHGASLIAISPEVADRTDAMVTKNGLEFSVLRDAGNRVAEQYGLLFKMPSEHERLLNNHGLLAENINGEPAWALADPCTFIIAQDGTIAWRFSPDGDYRVRAEPEAILAELERMAIAKSA